AGSCRDYLDLAPEAQGATGIAIPHPNTPSTRGDVRTPGGFGCIQRAPFKRGTLHPSSYLISPNGIQTRHPQEWRLQVEHRREPCSVHQKTCFTRLLAGAAELAGPQCWVLPHDGTCDRTQRPLQMGRPAERGADSIVSHVVSIIRR